MRYRPASAARHRLGDRWLTGGEIFRVTRIPTFRRIKARKSGEFNLLLTLHRGKEGEERKREEEV